MNQRHVLLTSFLLLLFLSGCFNVSHEAGRSTGASVTPPAGSMCKVHFNRNALGLAGNAPAPMDTDVFNGAEVSVTGEFVKMSDSWLVLKITDDKQRWIPRQAILQMTVESQ